MTSVDTAGVIVDERRQYRNNQTFIVPPLPAAFAPSVVETVAIAKQTIEKHVKSENINVQKPKSTSIPTTEHPHRPSPPSSAPVFDIVSNKPYAGGSGARRKHVAKDTVTTSHPPHPHAPTKQSVFDVVDHTRRRSPKDYPPIASQTRTPRSTGLLFYPVPGDSSSDSRRTVTSLSGSQLRNGPVQHTQSRINVKNEQTIPSHLPAQPVNQDQQKSPRSNIISTAKPATTTARVDRFAMGSATSEDRLITSKSTGQSAAQSTDGKVSIFILHVAEMIVY